MQKYFISHFTTFSNLSVSAFQERYAHFAKAVSNRKRRNPVRIKEIYAKRAG